MRATTINRADAGFTIFLVAVIVFPFFSQNVQAQTDVSTKFAAYDRFLLPEYNGSLRFSLNGTFSSATYINGSWVFRDLTLNGSQLLGDLQISAENSNLTIFSYRAFNFSGFRITAAQIRYNAVGAGKQSINFLTDFGKTDLSEWSVVTYKGTKTDFLAEGDKWQLLPNNTVILNNIIGNVSVVHYHFLDNNPDSNLPFYQQHRIIIVVAVVLTTTILLTVVFKFRFGAKKDGL